MHNSHSKKSEALALQTIVIAAIVLIVLIVLIAIFSGRLGFFSKGVEDCTAKGGVERTGDAPCSTDAEKNYIKTPMRTAGKYCCIPV